MKKWLFLLIFSVLSILHRSTFAEELGTWRFPLDGWRIAYHEREDGLALENTRYGVRNLDLFLSGPDYITCFGVAGNRALHAGMDMYPTDLTQTAVYAVSEGPIMHILRDNNEDGEGGMIIIRHGVGSETVYSLYRHIVEIPTGLQVGYVVSAGTVLGEIKKSPHEGRFPEFHPDDDDTHLHFELRKFASAENIGLPSDCVVDPYRISGVGYTYPNHPNSYGYLDPIAYLNQHGVTTANEVASITTATPTPVPTPVISPLSLSLLVHKLYLPLIIKSPPAPPPCNYELSDRLARNREFEEGSLDDPTPWVTLSTSFRKDDNFLPNPALISTEIYKQGVGHRSASLGNLDGVYDADQEILTPFTVPSDAKAGTWSMDFELNASWTTERNDALEFGIYDAKSGEQLLVSRIDSLWPYSYQDGPEGRWVRLNLKLNEAAMNRLDNRTLFLSYLGMSEIAGGGSPRFSADNASFIAHCQAKYANQSELIAQEVSTVYTQGVPTSLHLAHNSIQREYGLWWWLASVLLLGMTTGLIIRR